MPFRDPLYLDVQTLISLADYYEIELPGATEVTRRTLAERRGHAGVDRVVQARRERGSSEEITETYATDFRPVRAMNDVIDRLLGGEDIVDLNSRPDAPIKRRDIVQLEGDLTLSPATEIGLMWAALLPTLISESMTNDESNELDPAVLGQLVMGNQGDSRVTHVYTIESDVPDTRIYVLVDPKHLFGGTEMEDIDGELTVFGTVDKLVPQGRTFSLDRYLLPGVSRAARRAFRGEALEGLLQGAEDMVGRQVSSEDLEVSGPALLVRPAAIF